MENSGKNIDLLFQKKFEDFKPNPPESVWKKIKANIPNNLIGGGTGGFSSIKTIVIVLILAVPAYFIINSQGNKKLIKNKTLNTQNSKPVNITEKRNKKEITPQKTSSEKIINNKKTTSFVKEEITKTLLTSKQTEKTKITNHTTSTNKASVTNNQNTVIEDNDLLLAYLPQENKNTIKEEPEARSSEKKTLISEPEVAVYSPKIKKKGYFAFGAFFTPEMIFYTSDDIANKTNLNLDLSISYNYKKLFFESGLGVGLSKDDGNYNIDYESLDFLGTYEDVYNVTFDSTENGVIPTYHTETVEVYDSINHVEISQTKNTYTYLQIPLFIGYKLKSNKFSYSLKGGPSLSVLIYENIPEAVLPTNYISINNIDETNPGRIKTHWYFMLSAGIEYRLNDKMSVAFEPTFRYYMKSAYERKYITTKHPFSIGFRTGVLIKL